jgi:hypothetical protein
MGSFPPLFPRALFFWDTCGKGGLREGRREEKSGQKTKGSGSKESKKKGKGKKKEAEGKTGGGGGGGQQYKLRKIFL